VVVVLVVGLVGSAMAAPTAGRLSGPERRARLAHSLGILGALVAGFGVILFFAANWDDIPRPLRVVILLGGLVASYAAGFALREVFGRPNIGHAFLFLGTLLFGVSVFLVGQMYNVNTHDPFGFLIWALGALAIAWVIRSGPTAALGFASLFAWMVHEVVESAGDFDGFVVIPAYATLYGIALYAIGTAGTQWLEPVRFARPMRMLGYAFTVGGLMPGTFRDAHEFADFSHALDVTRISVIFWCLAAVAVLASIALALRWRIRRVAIGEAVVLLGSVALVLLALLAPEVEHPNIAAGEAFSDPGHAEIYPILFNVAVAVLAFGAVIVGMLEDEVWLANAGAIAVGIDVLARFFDEEWSMLERGVVMMLVGVAVLGLAALFERRLRPVEPGVT
jgi:uncharacterized membrane protein